METTTQSPDLCERVWRKDFRNAARAIPPHWLVRHEGALYIAPEYRREPRTELYHRLCTVGYARGWL